MCRTVHSIVQAFLCTIQMLVRVFMTIVLMIENLIRMFLQNFYNFMSFMMQMISLIPICLVFIMTAKMKCLVCGSGGACPVNRGGSCECFISAFSIVVVVFLLKLTGLLEVLFQKLGYEKTKMITYTRFVPTPGEVTECSREEEHEEDYITEDTTTTTTTIIETTTFNDNWNFRSNTTTPGVMYYLM